MVFAVFVQPDSSEVFVLLGKQSFEVRYRSRMLFIDNANNSFRSFEYSYVTISGWLSEKAVWCVI